MKHAVRCLNCNNPIFADETFHLGYMLMVLRDGRRIQEGPFCGKVCAFQYMDKLAEIARGLA